MKRRVQRVLSVALAAVILFVALPIPAMAAVYDQDGNELLYFYTFQNTFTMPQRYVNVLVRPDPPEGGSLYGVNVTVPVSGSYRVYFDLYRAPHLTYYFSVGSIIVKKGESPHYGAGDYSDEVNKYRPPDGDIDGFDYACPSPVTLEAGLPYFIRVNGLTVRTGANGDYTYGVSVYLQRVDGTPGDTTHYVHGGTSRGGGASRRYNTVEVKDKDGNVLEGPADDALTGGDLWILNEEQKTVNLITNEGSKSYTYNNYTYNTETGETTVYTTTNETIKITSYEEHVNVNYVDNSGTTIIYNYYYTPDSGGSSSEPDTPGGGSSEPDTPGGDSSVPDTPGGDGGGNIFTGLIDMITGLFSGLKSLFDLITTGIPDMFNSVKSFVDMLGGVLSYIPAEIWTLIGLGVAAVIVLRILGR